jgi:hypothetical protein
VAHVANCCECDVLQAPTIADTAEQMCYACGSHDPASYVILHLCWALQGIDTAGAEPQLVYVCAGMEVPAHAPPHSDALDVAAAPGYAAAPGESLSGSGPADPDPAVDRVWGLASRPAATKKIW